MQKSSNMVYKTLVVGVIVLFIGVGIQPAFAVNTNTSVFDNDDNCDLCLSVGNNNKTICEFLMGLSNLVQVRMILYIFFAHLLEFIPFKILYRIINPLIYIRILLFLSTYGILRNLLIKYDCFDIWELPERI